MKVIGRNNILGRRFSIWPTMPKYPKYIYKKGLGSMIHDLVLIGFTLWSYPKPFYFECI